MSYDIWKTRSPDDDLAGPEEPSHEQQKADWEDQMQQTREETHKKLLDLRDRAARQPISYKPLFNEAVDIAADLLHELCERDAGVQRS